MKKLLEEDDECKIIKYYDYKDDDNDEKRNEDIEACQGRKKKTNSGIVDRQRLINAILSSESHSVIITKLWFSDVNYKDINDSLKTFEKDDFFGKIYADYDEAFSRYNNDGNVNKEASSQTLNQIIDYNITKVDSVIKKNDDDSYNLDLEVCIDIKTDRTIKIDDIKLKVSQVGKKDESENFTLAYSKLSKSQNICSSLEGFVLTDINNLVTYPLVFSSTIKYKPFNSFGNYITKMTNRLYSGRIITRAKSSVKIKDYYDFKTGTYSLSASDLIHVGGKIDDSYIYNWTINTEGCYTFFKSGLNIKYTSGEKCKDKSPKVELYVYTLNPQKSIASATTSLEPRIQTKELTILNNSISFKSGEEKRYEILLDWGQAPYKISYEAGQNIEIISSKNKTLVLKATNDTDVSIDSSLSVTVIDKNDATQSKDIKVTISASSNISTINIRRSKEKPVANYKNYNSVKKNDTIKKQWGILNTSKNTLKSVFLRWDEDKSYSTLEHSKSDIIIGDMKPYDIKIPSLDIKVLNNSTGKNFGYFNIYHINNGKEEKLKYEITDTSFASLIYTLSVDEVKKDKNKPFINNIHIEINNGYINGSFTAFQENNKIKNLRVHFSLYKNFSGSNNEYIDIGSYDSIQNAGEKSFTFDASKWSGKMVYWKIEISNQSGLKMDQIQKGNIFISQYIPSIPNKPTLNSPNNNSNLTNTTPKLTWNSVSGASYYNLVLGIYNGDLAGIVYKNLSVSSTYKISEKLIKGNKYAWGVKACNSAGCSDFSATRYFVILKDTKPEIPVPEVPTKPTVSSFNASDYGSTGDGQVRVNFNVSSNSNLSLVRTHCGVGSNYNNSKYKDSSNSTGSKTSILQNSAWIGQTVYCKAEVKDTANNVASIKSDSVRLSSALVTKPTVSSFNASDYGSTGDGQVRVNFNVSSNSNLSLVRTHCGVGSNYNNSKYKDSSNSTGSKTSILQNSAWIGQTVY